MSPENENKHPNQHQNQFGVPEGYFQDSANRIAQRIEWEAEHEAYPRLVALRNKTGFVLPERYFEGSSTQLELLEYPALFAHKKQNPFSVPEDYFAEKEIQLLAEAFENTPDELAGFTKLNSIQRELPFTVSEDHFTRSETRIISSLQGKTKVIALFNKRIWYSAAAALFVAVLGLWLYQNYFRSAKTDDCGTLACIDRYELVKTKNLDAIDNEDLYEIVDSKELEKKLNDPSAKDTKKETDSLKGVSVDDLPEEI